MKRSLVIFAFVIVFSIAGCTGEVEYVEPGEGKLADPDAVLDVEVSEPGNIHKYDDNRKGVLVEIEVVEGELDPGDIDDLFKLETEERVYNMAEHPIGLEVDALKEGASAQGSFSIPEDVSNYSLRVEETFGEDIRVLK